MPGDTVSASTTIALPPDKAFELFTAGIASWWPREYTWSQDVLEEIAIEPGEGGFCVERGPHGFTVHWGRVETWERPERLVFTWQIGPSREPVPDPNRAERGRGPLLRRREHRDQGRLRASPLLPLRRWRRRLPRRDGLAAGLAPHPRPLRGLRTTRPFRARAGRRRRWHRRGA